jgi:hypothetical protein
MFKSSSYHISREFKTSGKHVEMIQYSSIPSKNEQIMLDFFKKGIQILGKTKSQINQIKSSH